VRCVQARKLRAELDAGSPLTRLCQHAGSALLAAAADDLVIRMCVPSARACGIGSEQDCLSWRRRHKHPHVRPVGTRLNTAE